MAYKKFNDNILVGLSTSAKFILNIKCINV